MPTRSGKRRLFRHAAEAVFNQPWLVEPAKLEAIAELIDLRRHGLEFTDAEIRERCGVAMWDTEDDAAADEDKPYQIADGVAVVDVIGTLLPRVGSMERISGDTTKSTSQMKEAFQLAMQDPEAKAILLLVDSPGGAVTGVPEFGDAVYAARGQGKPIWAINNGMMASGGYWIGAAAERVLASTSALTGSIGVYTIHGERSKADERIGYKYNIVSAGKHKVDANGYEPLSDQGRATLQERVDAIYEQFIGSVARYRGTNSEAVRNGYGQGKVLLSQTAVAANLIDGVQTFEQTLAELQAQVKRSGGGSVAPPKMNSFRVAAQGDQPPQHIFLPKNGGDPVDPKLKAALVAKGLIAQDASDDLAQVSLNAFFMARGQAVPAKAEDAVTALFTAAAQQVSTLAQVVAPLQTGVTANDKAAIIAAEQERVSELWSRAAVLGVSAAAVDASIKANTPVAEAVNAWTADLAKANKPVAHGESFSQDQSQLDNIVAAASDVLTIRAGQSLSANGKGGVKLTDAQGNTRRPHAMAAALQYVRFSDIAEMALKAANISVIGKDREDVIKTFMQLSMKDQGRIRLSSGPDLAFGTSFNSPGMYPNLLAAVANKLLEGYIAPSPVTYRKWAKQMPSVTDFKPTQINRYALGGELPRKLDNDEFEQSKMSEDTNWIAVEEYGEKFGITPRMLANDDLSVFTDFLPAQLIKMERTLNALCLGVLTGNPTLPDGTALLATTRGNLMQQNDISINTININLARQAMRGFTSVDGNDVLGLSPVLCLVPNGRETEAEQFFAPNLMVPATDTNVNVFRGKIEPVPEPMLSATNNADYYLFTDLMLAAAVVFTHQQGFESGKREMWYDPNTGNSFVSIEARMAAAANNWRGVLKLEDNND